MEKRIIELEIHITEQENTIEDLSSIVIKQWKKIDFLQKKLDALMERFLVLEKQSKAHVPVTRPPHW
ncbi:MAG: SlyX protein [Candidatus Tokpelaia sp. JSC189]|nr:MAG: SlyX protein [Candidatus Tokpelaia sp. JSC189]